MNTAKVKSVLLIEDEADILLVLGEYLRHMGFLVFTARDGLEALHLLKSIEMPHIILLDMRMPRMNGEEFASTFTKQYPQSRTPFILMSAAPDAKQRAQEIGAVDFLGKPFNLKELIKKLNTHLS